MNRSNKNYLLAASLCLFFISLKSQDLTIGVHSSVSIGDMNLSTVVAGGVTTFSPTGVPCQLTDVTLNAALATGNVNINTPAGSIIFTPGTFNPSTADRTLTLTASADVTLTLSVDTLGGSGFTPNTTKINVTINAGANALIGVTETLLVGGNLTVNASDIKIQQGGLETGGGIADFTATNKFETVGNQLSTNGGNLKIVAKDINILAGGIDTGGGDVELIVSNVIDLGEHSIRTFNGMFVASAVDFNGNGSNLRDMGTGKISLTLTGALVCSGDGFVTNGGDITINAATANFNSSGIRSTNSKVNIELTGALASSGNSLVTTNKDIEIKAASAMITSTGIQTPGGDIKLEIVGDILISGGGAISNNYFSSGNKLTLQGTGISTNGNVVIDHLDIVSVSGGGIATNGGSLSSKGKQFIMHYTQITSNNGNIVFCHSGNFDIDGGGISTGTGTVDIGTIGNVIVGGTGIITDGSSVKILAKDGNISTSGGAINTGLGSSMGGVLTETGSITQVHPIQLGGGDVILNTVSDVACLIVYDYDSNNKLMFGDPCSCGDPLNCEQGGIYYFHDTLTVTPVGMTSGLSIAIATGTASDFYTGSCGSLALATTDAIPEVGTSGVYKLEFWRPSGATPALMVTAGVGPPQVVPSTTFDPICTQAACAAVAVPTIGQWGVLILLLSMMILGLVAIRYREYSQEKIS